MTDTAEQPGCYVPDPKYTFCFAPKDKITCVICTESELTLPSRTLIKDSDPSLLPCGHAFGTKCLKLWLENHDTCPVCRFKLRYELCHHPVSPQRLTKANILFVPPVVPKGGYVGLQCHTCWKETDQQVASEILMPLTETYYKCKEIFERTGAELAREGMVATKKELRRMTEALSPPEEHQWCACFPTKQQPFPSKTESHSRFCQNAPRSSAPQPRADSAMTARDQALSSASFWDERYSSKSDGNSAPTHEWFRSFSDLEPFFVKDLFTVPGLTPADNPLVLHLGSGDSVIPLEFAARGYKHQLCADFSSAVVELMKDCHAGTEGIEWRLMDVRDMKGLDDSSVDVAFDKGTFDAMIYGSPWSPPQEVRDNTSAYLRQVHRVLKDSGRFLYVTFRQPHFMKPLLNPEGLFDVEMQTLSDEGSFDYYTYVIRKAGVEKPAGNGSDTAAH
ncbi:hypothetical protein N0V88_003043 [Collariella sp. IMI 366227]|nr:hypothetical protein N0V88_003043 [Collariella sp. IMI 366227]